jgi:pimeloyl-ACP methyl ester carboxylesterase
LEKVGYGPIYVWGQSLGSGMAAAVCADAPLPVHGLNLISPWDNIANVGFYFYPYLPVRLLMIDKRDSAANLKHFQHPICVIMGDKEQTTAADPESFRASAGIEEDDSQGRRRAPFSRAFVVVRRVEFYRVEEIERVD